MRMGRIVLNNFLGSVIRFTVLFVGVFSFSVCAANTLASGWTSLGGNPGEEAVISALRSQTTGMNVSVDLPGFSSTTTSFNNENWQSLSFPNQCITDVVGAPDLPILRRYFAVPKNAIVKVEVTDVVFETFENVKIQPFQRLLYENETAAERKFAKDEKLYKTDKLYPEAWATSTESVIMHGVQMSILKVNPFRYNPVTKEVQAASKITCRVTYVNPNPVVGLTYPSHLKNNFKALLLNFDFMEYRNIPSRSKRNLSRATDYLMICDSKFLDHAGLKSLADLYTSQGYTVELADASGIGTSSSAIKDHIQSLYDGGELDYVLFVGDLDKIPHYQTRTESDSWYSWLDGDDKVGDIGLGRMPATDETELNYMVNKTLAFQTGAEPGEWRRKSVLIAHKENYPDKYTGCKNDIFEHEYALEVPEMDKCYGGEDATNSDITDAINEGRLVVNYRGHGSATAWTGWNGSSYSTSDAMALANGKKTPVVYMMACTNGKLSGSSHCLAEAFLCQEQGGVWALAATTTSLTTVNHDYDRGLYYGAWDDGIETVGDLRNHADAWALQESGSNANSNITMYVCFGDPLINILNVSNIPYITASSPPGGAELEQGFKFEVKWGDNIPGKVKIELLKAGSVVSELAPSIESIGTFEWDVPGNLATGSDYKVRITSLDSTALFAETNGTFSVIEEYIIKEYDHVQNFDDLTISGNLPKKWEQIASPEDNLQWTVWTDKTPTKFENEGAATGPNGDNTSGSGNYIYVESSSGNYPDKTADFISSKFKLSHTNDAVLEFYYHMFSDNEGTDEMGDLYLDICVDGTWETDVFHINGDQGDEWHKQEVPLDKYKGERVVLKFRAVTGSGWGSDICLDDIKISCGSTSTKLSTKVPMSFDLRLHGSKLHFQMPGDKMASHPLSIKLYNLQGKMVKTLVNENVKSGYHSLSLDKIAHAGKRISLGMYVCRMETKGYSKTINVILTK